MKYKAIGLGVFTGGILYYFWLGVDVTPVIIFAAFIGGLLYFGKTRFGGKSFASFEGMQEKKTSVVFEDIGGQEVAKNELREALEFIRNVEGISSLGIRPLKGILLEGPAGNRKNSSGKSRRTVYAIGICRRQRF